MGKEYLNRIENNTAIHTVFVDFFDTIVHRTVHPNQVIRIWAKLMIRELGLTLKIDELYFIRKDSLQYLANRNNTHFIEVDSKELIKEVYNRLDCTNKLGAIAIEKFTEYFELSDYRAEIKSQYLNSVAINALKELKENGYKLYCVSDFYTSRQVLEDIIVYHKIENLFDDVFVSSQCSASKHTGSLYPFLMEKLGLSASSIAMIGDNYRSDIKNAGKYGITTVHVSNKKESKTKKRYAIGSDRKDYRRILNRLYSTCNNRKAPANSDYILFYAVYIERLYYHAKKEKLKNIFFLAREGLFLKRMFDHYQEHFALKDEDKIKTHYFKTSRQASMLVSLKGVDEEKYTFLKRKYPNLSPSTFLRNFTFSEELISLIIDELNFQDIRDKVIPDFLESEEYQKLSTNETFRAAYDKNRFGQQKAFKTYLCTFGVDFEAEGMHLADIGWGGSMQECLFDYFEGKVEVHGHYLGLNEVYSIQKSTSRWGLNFSILPYATYSDNILRGNTELNEQLLSAGHGSTLSYNHLDTFTNEFHHEVEKNVYKNHIFEIQEFMFGRYKEFLKDLDSVCYDDDIVQNEMTDYALRAGLFASKRKVASAMKIAEGFYTNVGDFSYGMKISPKKYSKDKFKLFKTFLLSPEKLFPLLLRIKPYLYSKEKYFISYLVPSALIYYYIKMNRRIKTSLLQNFSRFKYDHLK